MSISGLAQALLQAVQTAYGITITDTNFYTAAQTLVPAGTVHAFAGSSAPAGYVLCDGSAISRTTFANLFAVIGSTYGGGDGSTTFNVPNFKGAFLRGAGSQVVGGITYSGTLGVTQADAFQGHWHLVKTADNIQANKFNGGSSEGLGGNGDASTLVYGKDIVSDTVNGTPRISTETRPMNVCVNYIIAT